MAVAIPGSEQGMDGRNNLARRLISNRLNQTNKIDTKITGIEQVTFAQERSWAYNNQQKMFPLNQTLLIINGQLV